MIRKEEKIYYHYCSVDTFFNIIQTSTLRLGDPLSMNDSAEIMWFLDLIENYASEKGKYKKTVENWKLIEKMIEEIIKKIDFPYILCLSKKNDVLSQWRSYADDGKGIAIGIDVNELINYGDGLSGHDIVYKPEEQINILEKREIGKCLNELEETLYCNNEQVLYSKVKKLISHLLEDSMICKNPAFEEENEYRILYRNSRADEGKISDIKFRTNNGSILPYREIQFESIKGHLIKNIIMGPKTLLSDRNLWLFLKQQKFKWREDENINFQEDKKWKQHVKVSKATYR